MMANASCKYKQIIGAFLLLSKLWYVLESKNIGRYSVLKWLKWMAEGVKKRTSNSGISKIGKIEKKNVWK